MRTLPAARSRPKRIAPRVLLALIVLAILGNGAFFFLAGRTAGQPFIVPRQIRGTQVILATRVNEQQILVATNANTLLLYTNGHATHRLQFPTLIGGFAASSDGKTLYVGTSDGKVTVLDNTLTRQRSFQVNGRVVGLTMTDSGGLLVAYGQGAYSGLYYVSYYPHPRTARRPTSTTQVAFTATALTAYKTTAIYGLLNSQVGAITVRHGGKITWQTTLSNPVTQLLAVPQTKRILAGDQKGGLTLLDERGGTHWQMTLSQYPLRALAFDPASGDYFAGDDNGALFVLNKTGKLILTRQVASSSIEAIIPQSSGSLLVVPGDGQWLAVDPAAIGGLGQAAQIGVTWLWFDGAMLVAILAALVAAVRRLRRLAVRAWHARLAYVFILPALGLIGVFTYYPAATAVYYSLTDFSLRNVTQFVGLQNYAQIFTSDFYFRTGLVNMVILIVSSVIKAVTVPLLVAELIFWLRNRVHQYVFRTLFVLPAVVPGLVFTLLWKQVYDPRTGLLNQLLALVGLSQWQQAWLGDASTAIWAIVGVGFPYVDAFAFLILMGGLLNINGEFFDAAKVDGAGWWSRFRHIDVPLLVAQFRILLFFAITGTVQGFASIFILTQGGPGYATYVPALQMYLRISDGDFGYASAIGVVLFAMILVMTLFILRFRRQDAIEIA